MSLFKKALERFRRGERTAFASGLSINDLSANRVLAIRLAITNRTIVGNRDDERIFMGCTTDQILDMIQIVDATRK